MIPMIILGIDPGTAKTGWAVIKKGRNKKLSLLDYGCISTSSKLSPAKRLSLIYKEVRKRILDFKPDVVAIEEVFFNTNAKTVISVSQSQGVTLLAAEKAHIPVVPYAPLRIKMVVCENGRTKKDGVQRKVKKILGLKEIPRPHHAADAIAIAICHAVTAKSA
jgi:crossover junction endodeoxyribonuclease RuvC